MSAEIRAISAYDAEMLAFTSTDMSSGPWAYVAEQDEGSSRWASHHTLVVRHDDGTFWGLSYEMGLTEYQDHDFPWQGVDADEPLPMVQLFAREYVAFEYLTASAYRRKTGGVA